MVEIKGKDIVIDGKVLQIKGYNLGNWLMLERYMFGFPGTDQIFRRYFRYFAGDDKYYDFFDLNKVPYELKNKPLFIHLDMSLTGDKTGIAGV